jgi:hypothetical protein
VGAAREVNGCISDGSRFTNLGRRQLALSLRDLPANQLSAMPNGTSGAHVEGIVRHKEGRIDSRQEIGLSYMAEDFVLPR